MTEIKIDGAEMIGKKQANRYIKERLCSKEYHGENLDSLWDVLSTYDKRVEIILINTDQLIENLGEYGRSIVKVFYDAKVENDNIDFKITR